MQYIIATESHGNKENDDSSNNEEHVNKYKCIVCDINYKNALNYNKHIRDDDACSIFHRLESILPKYCANKGCREFFKTNSDLTKHMNFHCHLTKNERKISHINNQDEITLNRCIFEHRGLPRNDTFISNDAIFYNAADKTWQCQICNKNW